jgi:Epoxide hydrolase N terminus
VSPEATGVRREHASFTTSLEGDQMSEITDMTEAAAISTFEIDVPDETVADLRRRLGATRWPDGETVADQSQGTQLTKMQELVSYWGSGYDWRKLEARLNALTQFTTEVDGIVRV